MHEFHAWIGLEQSTYESDDRLQALGVARVRDFIAETEDWHNATFRVDALNGSYFLTATGLINRMRGEGQFLDDLLALVVEALPGSYGLVYDRADEMPEPVGNGAFRVRRVARGVITELVDTHLSPYIPVIEDPEP